MERTLPFAVLISGRGSNMLALARAVTEGRIAGRMVTVISDQPGAAGLVEARRLGLAAEVVDAGPGTDRPALGQRLTEILKQHGAELVVLAGFMRILDSGFVQRWRGCLLNIHPSLLPAHRGLHTHRRVLAAGDPQHGCTVHFVTEELDAGPAIMQGRFAVGSGDTEESLSARVQQLEHIIYPRAVGWFAAGRLGWKDGAAMLDGRPLTTAVIEDVQ
ncbi:MAG: phosphoribosylglycinamide formyltransferase [Gammaproteobacteria bacterium]|nr:phosphoribosylglycinamide formyltransferase [Gammaproteobacteria bacterium]